MWEAKLEVGVETPLAFCLSPDSDHFLVGTAHGAALCKVVWQLEASVILSQYVP